MAAYYVDNSGSDGVGSRDDPWNNIAGHIHSLSAGDTMYVRGNTSRKRCLYAVPRSEANNVFLQSSSLGSIGGGNLCRASERQAWFISPSAVAPDPAKTDCHEKTIQTGQAYLHARSNRCCAIDAYPHANVGRHFAADIDSHADALTDANKHYDCRCRVPGAGHRHSPIRPSQPDLQATWLWCYSLESGCARPSVQRGPTWQFPDITDRQLP
jgi:hypothetical protein